MLRLLNQQRLFVRSQWPAFSSVKLVKQFALYYNTHPNPDPLKHAVKTQIRRNRPTPNISIYNKHGIVLKKYIENPNYLQLNDKEQGLIDMEYRYDFLFSTYRIFF